MTRRLLAVALIVAGIALVAWGYNVYDSASAVLGRTLSGRTPIEAWIGMVGGALCVATGVFKLK